ncbi:MAG: hypothetical protein M3P32_07995 [Chloroflexota bacterium]|nr:hypothetical protein [Chloroflexota bacterium]
MTTPSQPAEDLARIVEAAQRMGVELDEAEALRWLSAMAADTGGEIVLDAGSGTFGHRVSMLDFSPANLAHFRSIGRIVGFEDRPGVETALALSGSAAQSKIQTNPGDCDYFERVNIHAPTREEACRLLAELMRDKALATERGDTYRLIEVKFGSAPSDVLRDGKLVAKGSALSWTPAELREGRILATTPLGEPIALLWSEVAIDPGWCKLDWVVANPARGTLANASNMLDVTWEAPDGTITPLDGHLDGYFQEVYLEADSIPIFSKLVRNATPDALDEYVAQLEHEVAKYVTQELNYGKAAKRMYNVFRLTGRYIDAAYLRELFDEPAAMLYQVWALVRTIDDAVNPDQPTTMREAVSQADALIIQVAGVLDGAEEAEIVKTLVRLRAQLDTGDLGAELTTDAEAARELLKNLVNSFFHDRLVGVPTINEYIERLQGEYAQESAR